MKNLTSVETEIWGGGTFRVMKDLRTFWYQVLLISRGFIENQGLANCRHVASVLGKKFSLIAGCVP